ncbi:alpha-L-fucosidase [Paenibacillus sp. GCM10028914]|uniref:alpha-L-fucosidase n=1 Tax=Paenibacillus sp. GCM10028914 TaxID=3273416 RepID=UPI003610D696
MRKRLSSLLLVACMVLGTIPIFPSVSNAALNSQSMLDIGFGGSFSTEKGYTASTGETMDGKVNRRTGNEQLVFGEGVVLNGGTNGIEFLTTNSFGSTTIDETFIVETVFKPQGSQNTLGTLIGVMGNLYARYQSGTTLEYGFAVNNNGTWTEYKGTTSAPEAGKEHAIALVYQPTSSGAELRAFLNGKELTPAVSKNGRAAISGGGSEKGKFSFGNEVHTAALNRGFKGSISQAVVAGFQGDFSPSLLKTMSLSTITRTLSVKALGTLNQTDYIPSEDEVIKGKLNVEGGQITGLGRLNMNGGQSKIVFTPNTPFTGEGKLASDFAVEMTTAPSSIQPGTVLFDVGGAVEVRRSAGESLEIVSHGETLGNVDVQGKLTGDFVHLSLVYKGNSNGTGSVSLWSGQEQLGNSLSLSEIPAATRETIAFGGMSDSSTGEKSLKGEVYGVAFGTLEGNFKPELLGLLGGPCMLPTGLNPGYRIPISQNECPAALAAKASLVRPEPRQVTWQEYEQTAFLHYGINTYYDVEWGNFNEDPNKFQPTELDTDQWAKSLKESGFKMAILTVKHHDGFLLYPSRYTDFSVKSSSWKDGEGDVLREFVTSMRKYGIKIGVYLSPADHNAYTEGIFGNGSQPTLRNIPTLVEGDDRAGNTELPTFNLPATDYGSRMLNQLYEVLTEYGEIDEVWFDGAQGNVPGNRSEKYDWESYYSIIRALAPNAVIAVSGNDVRWVGNESGRARENEWSVLGAKINEEGKQVYHPSYTSPDLGSRAALADAASKGMEYLTWFPAEVDVSIRPGWFYHANQQPKSVNELRNIYYQSVARNSVLLLNIPPDKRGKLPDADVARLKEWNLRMKRDFAVNHATRATVTSENGAVGTDPAKVIDGNNKTSWQSSSVEPSSLVFKLDQDVEVDKVLLQEDITQGQQVESFAVDIRRANGDWEQIASGGVIGYKRVLLLPSAVTGKEFRIRILKSRGPVHLAEVGLYPTVSQISDTAELDSQIAESKRIHDDAVEGTKTGQYPAGSKPLLLQAIQAAQLVSGDPMSTQEQVTKAKDLLKAALDKFKSSVIGEQTLTATITGPDKVKGGEAFDAKIGLNHVSNNIFAQDMTIQFDDQIMEFVSAESLIEGVQIVETVTKIAGQVRIIAASEGAEHAVAADADILNLKFRTKITEGVSSGKISISDVTLGDENGTETKAEVSSLTIDIITDTPVNSGDLNGDGKVSIGDLAIAASHYGKDQNSPDWQTAKRADVNGDGKIDILDLATIASKITQ